jgi:ribonuclease BN (tRNA processing enzyme)
MRLTVLGSCASYADSGRACSGHLVESGGKRVLLDCGNGALANLSRACDPTTLDAVFISHAHPDHFVDIYALQALLRYAPDGPAPAVPLYTPEGLFERMSCLLTSRGAREMAEAFVPAVLTAGSPVDIGGLTVTPRPVSHGEASFALVTDARGSRLAYTADTAPGDLVEAAATGADVLLAEATLPAGHAGAAPHMTAAEAAGVAARAGAHTLVLTHMWPTTPREAILAEAEAVFAGEVLLADEMLSVEIRRSGARSTRPPGTTRGDARPAGDGGAVSEKVVDHGT